MRLHDDPKIIAMGNRIKQAAKARGYSSSRPASGVNVNEVAKIIDASYEMTRRYLEGKAEIPIEKMQLLAESLQVSLVWLFHGKGTMEQEKIDSHILEECLETVFEAEENSKTKLSAKKKSKLVAQLYMQRINGIKSDSAILVAAFKSITD